MILGLKRQAGRLLAMMALVTLLAGSSVAGRSTNTIWFYNDTDENLSAAVGFLDQYGRWVFNGYWTLGPGEYAHVANNRSRKTFVWALGFDTATEWRGGLWYTVRKDGKKRSFRSWDTGSQWGEFTYTFHY